MTVQEELRTIEAEHGILRPEDVVEFARNKKTALHSQFEWDDSEAAQKYRLWQARYVISTSVTIIEAEQKKYAVRAFVSLTPDRRAEGGGYRSIASVMTDDEMKAQLFKDALAELGTFRRKYHSLKQLSEVFEAIDALSQAEVEPERELVPV